jgi:hypothetical protein
VGTTLLAPPTSTSAVAVQRACSACDCSSYAGQGDFCEGCGHEAAQHHRTAMEMIAAACTECECLTFRGGPAAAHCARCGHPRGLHSLEDAAEPLPEGLAPRQLAVVAALLAAAGGGLVAWGLVLL